MYAIFPRYHNILQTVGETFNSYITNGKQKYFNEKSSVELNMTPNNQAFRKKLGAAAPIKFIPTVESFLELPEMHCLKVTLQLASPRSCIHCIVRTIKSPVLLVSISYSEMTILAPNFFIQTLPRECSGKNKFLSMVLASSELCKKYLDSHAIIPKFYPEVKQMKAPASWKQACLLVHANLHSAEKCWNCLRGQLEKYVKINGHASSKWTLLLWTGPPGITDSTPFKHAAWECHTRKTCLKVERLQDTICIEHESFLKRIENNNVEKAGIQFSDKHIIGELWPPTHRVVEEYYNFDTRSILLIGFTANDTFNCTSCLMIRSEVFFVYTDPVDPASGHVWMTQNHDDPVMHRRWMLRTAVLHRC